MRIDWGTSSVLAALHLIVIIGIPAYLLVRSPSPWLLLASALLFVLTGLAITAGYHRLYAHKAYAVRPAAELPILFFGTLATQGSVWEWASKHRLHHRYVDTDRDPYSITKGFWHAHVLWMLQQRQVLDMQSIPDLARNRLLRFQHRHYLALVSGLSVAVTLLVGLLVGDLIGAFLFAWALRLLLSLHCTFFINSLAHTWGAKSYSRELSAVDNYALALLTFGEGYHNYHHTFASDYRNGVRWWHFDPTKWLIWTLAQARLASDLRRVDSWVAKRRLVLEDKKQLIAQLRTQARAKKAVLEQAVEDAATRYNERVAQLQRHAAEWRRARATRRRELRQRIRAQRRALRAEWRYWKRLMRAVAAAPAGLK